MSDGPLLVYGPRSASYDFGPAHPLTPRRFGPGIDLLRAIGAEPGLAPEPAPDAELLRVHAARYLAVVRRLSLDPFGPPEGGLGPGDDPAFDGMHEAAAAVAGGSLAALEAILRGEVEHAFHPGGGLHHAMRDRASGFCIYNDPALVVARARQAGRRVLYLDFDVHHGDGVEAIHRDDPGVMTVSFHESGRYLFPGTGFVEALGQGEAAGTAVNVPFEPPAGEGAWLTAVRDLVPLLAAAFGPDLIVSQHGCDGHALDPLAHLRLTTTAMGEAARLVDAVAHRHADGAWLATGGGGYDAYRVVPRAWSLVWLAGAHREVPVATPRAWRERWAGEAERYRQAPLPPRFADEPNAGLPFDAEQDRAERRALETVDLVRALTVPALLRAARDRGWWTHDARSARAQPAAVAGPGRAGPLLVGPLGPAGIDRMRLAPRVVAPADPVAGQRLLARAAADGAIIVGAVSGDTLVGIAVLATAERGQGALPGAQGSLSPDLRLVALGVAPDFRRHGLATALLRRAGELSDGRPVTAVVTLAERDPMEPLPAQTRAAIAGRLLISADFSVAAAPGSLGRADPGALAARRG